MTKKKLRFQGVDVDTLSGEYDNGSALHIAASNLGLEAAKVLLTYGADPCLKDDLARAPVDCIPDTTAAVQSSSEETTDKASFVNGTGENAFAAPSDEQRLKANKMRILLTRGQAGLQKIFPDEAETPERHRSPRRSSSSVRRMSASSSGIGSNGSSGHQGFVVSSKAVLQALGMKVSFRQW